MLADEGVDAESLAQILARQDSGGIAVGGDATLVQKNDSRAVTGGDRKIVEHDEDERAGAGGRLQHLHRVKLVAGVELGEGLIGEKDSCFASKRASKERTGALAAGQSRRRAIGKMGDVAER